MTRYHAFGMTIASAIGLPDLPPGGASPPGITISTGPIDASAADWFEIWPAERTAPRVRGARAAGGYLVAYDGSSMFELSSSGDSIRVEPAGCDAAVLRHRLLDQVLPLALSLRGAVLHASVVSIRHGAWAFIGPGGAGKSSLARACARIGWTVVADDAAAVGRDGKRFIVEPSYPGLRLPRPDGGKERLIPDVPFDLRPVPLAAVYAVDANAADCVRETPLPARDAAVAVLGQLFRLEQRDRAQLERELSFASALVAAVPVFHLAVPRDGNPRAVIAELIREYGAMAARS